MSIVSRTYTFLPKATVLTRPEFVSVTMIAVLREGVNQRIVPILTAGRQVKYQSGIGRLIFRVPGAGPGGANERITVIYKT